MHFKMLSAICLNLDQSKILSSDNGLMVISLPYDQVVETLKHFYMTNKMWLWGLDFSPKD